MPQTSEQETIFSEPTLFSRVVRAGEFTFVAQDARRPDGKVGTAQSAENKPMSTQSRHRAAAVRPSTVDVVCLSV